MSLREKRIQREIADFNVWRFADIRQVKSYQYSFYMSQGVKRRRCKIVSNTVYENPMFDVIFDDDDISRLLIRINYPDLSGSQIEAELTYPPNYPFEPFKIKLLSPVNELGCPDCLDRFGRINIGNLLDWTPSYTAGAVLLVLTSALFPKWSEKKEEFRQTERSATIKQELYEKTGIPVDL